MEDDLDGSDVEITFVSPGPTQLPISNHMDSRPTQLLPNSQSRTPMTSEARGQCKKQLNTVDLELAEPKKLVINQWLTVRKHTKVQSPAGSPNPPPLTESVPIHQLPISMSLSAPSPESLEIQEVMGPDTEAAEDVQSSVPSKIQPVCPSSLRTGGSIKGIVIPSPDAVPTITIPAATPVVVVPPVPPVQTPRQILPPGPQRFNSPIVIRNPGAGTKIREPQQSNSVILMPRSVRQRIPTSVPPLLRQTQQQNEGKAAQSVPTSVIQNHVSPNAKEGGSKNYEEENSTGLMNTLGLIRSFGEIEIEKRIPMSPIPNTGPVMPGMAELIPIDSANFSPESELMALLSSVPQGFSSQQFQPTNPLPTTSNQLMTFYSANSNELPSPSLPREGWGNEQVRTQSQLQSPPLTYAPGQGHVRRDSRSILKIPSPNGPQLSLSHSTTARGEPVEGKTNWSRGHGQPSSSRQVNSASSRFPTGNFNAPVPLLQTSPTSTPLPSFVTSFMHSGAGNYQTLSSSNSPQMQHYSHLPHSSSFEQSVGSGMEGASAVNPVNYTASHLNRGVQSEMPMLVPSTAYHYHQNFIKQQQQAHAPGIHQGFQQNQDWDGQLGPTDRNSMSFANICQLPPDTQLLDKEGKKGRGRSKKTGDAQLDSSDGNSCVAIAKSSGRKQQRKPNESVPFPDSQSVTPSTSSYQASNIGGVVEPIKPPRRKYERKKKDEAPSEFDAQGNLVVPAERKKSRSPRKKKEEPSPEFDAEGNPIPQLPKTRGTRKKKEEVPEFDADGNPVPKPEKKKRTPRKKGTVENEGLTLGSTLTPGENREEKSRGRKKESAVASAPLGPPWAQRPLALVPYPQMKSMEDDTISTLVQLKLGAEKMRINQGNAEEHHRQFEQNHGYFPPNFVPPPAHQPWSPSSGPVFPFNNSGQFPLTSTSGRESGNSPFQSMLSIATSEKTPKRRSGKKETNVHTVPLEFGPHLPVDLKIPPTHQRQLVSGQGMGRTGTPTSGKVGHPNESIPMIDPARVYKGKSYPAHRRLAKLSKTGERSRPTTSPITNVNFDDIRGRTLAPTPWPEVGMNLSCPSSSTMASRPRSILLPGQHSFPSVITTFDLSPPPREAEPDHLISENASNHPEQQEMSLGGDSITANWKKSTRRNAEPKTTLTPKTPRSRTSKKNTLTTTPMVINSPANPVLFKTAQAQASQGGLGVNTWLTTQLPSPRPPFADELRMSPSVTIQQLPSSEETHETGKETSKVQTSRIPALSQPPMDGGVKGQLSVEIILTEGGGGDSDQKMMDLKPVLSLSELTITKREDEEMKEKESCAEDLVVIQRSLEATSLKGTTEEEGDVSSTGEGRRRARRKPRVNYEENAQFTRRISNGSETKPHMFPKLHKNPNTQGRVVENPGFSWTYSEEELTLIFQDGGFLMRRADLGLEAEKLTIWKIIDKGGPSLTLKAYEPYSKKSSNRWFHVSNLVERNERFSETREWGAETVEVTRVFREAFLDYLPVYVDKLCDSPDISVVKLYREDRFFPHMVNIYKEQVNLKEPFYNLVRGIVYHSMDPTFLSKVVNSTIETNSPEAKSLRAGNAEISTLINSICQKFTSSPRWLPLVLARIMRFPKMCYSAKNCDKSRNCDGCAHSVFPLHQPTKAVTFEGLPYESSTLTPFPDGHPGNDDKPNPDYQFCHSCNNFLKSFHGLYHTKYHILSTVHFRLELMYKEFPENAKFDTMSVKEAFDADIDWYRWMFLDFLVNLSQIRIHLEQMSRVPYVNAT